MRLNLENFSNPKVVLVPVRDFSFVLDKKRYSISGENGWARAEITNNKARYIESASVVGSDLKTIQGYTHQNTIVFQNLDVARRKHSLGMQAPLHFNGSASFEAVKAVVWEDGQVYWAEPNYADIKALELKDLLDQEKNLEGIKGLTTELRSVFLFHALEREQMRRMIEEAKRAKDIQDLMTSIPGRLKLTFERAGGEMTAFEIKGKRIVVDWKMIGSNYQFNSVIDSDTWMIVEAGYCMSGDDKRHNITSMVKTAQLYEDVHGRINITRTSGDDQRVRGPHMDNEFEDDEDF